MRIKPLHVLYAFLACLILIQCKKEDIAGPAGPPGPDGQNGASGITGIIQGKVILYDSLGKPLNDYSGSTVSIGPTNPSITASTQKDGLFTSAAFSSGNYNLSISKAGYGTMKLYGVQNTGGVNASETGNIELGAIQSSWDDIKSWQVDTASQNEFRYMDITITLAHPHHIPPGPEIVIYLSSSPGANNSKNNYAYRTNFYQLNDSTLLYSYFDINLALFSDILYRSDYLYMAAAIDNPKIFTYTDESGNTVYPCVGNLSNEVKVYNYLK